MTTLHTLSHASAAVEWLRSRVTGTLQVDSRLIQPGDGFIAWPGAATDGRAYVAQAVARGAVACLVEAQGVDAFDLHGDHLAQLSGLKAATGPIAAEWFGWPSRQLDVLAVTGTNGKTSTAWWLAQALNLLSKKNLLTHAGCAMVGTLGVGIPGSEVSTGLTTPDPVCLQGALAAFVADGLGACAMEASSIGLEERRLDGTSMRVALFTNFTQDHLDYHPTMEAYWLAKRALFDWPGLQAAVVNVDDAHGAQLHAQLHAELAARGDLDLWSVSIVGAARLHAEAIVHQGEGLAFTVVEGAARHALQTRLVGRYNVSNLLGVIAGMRTLGVSLADALAVCAELTPVPGRMQQIAQPGQPLVAVDYAHTPDALAQAIQALQSVAQQRGGQLVCVFGCGGNRDATKRPLMGAVAQRSADVVVVTSDNPRGEVPETIIEQILKGMTPGDAVRVQPDRALAIAQAIGAARSADVVLLAGKGHEDYQEVHGERHAFSDMDHARIALAARGGAV